MLLTHLHRTAATRADDLRRCCVRVSVLGIGDICPVGAPMLRESPSSSSAAVILRPIRPAKNIERAYSTAYVTGRPRVHASPGNTKKPIHKARLVPSVPQDHYQAVKLH